MNASFREVSPPRALTFVPENEASPRKWIYSAHPHGVLSPQETLMPSILHQTLCELFHARPHLAAELLEAARLLPTAANVEGELLPADLSQSSAPEYRADVVVKLSGDAEMTVIIEAQLQPDPTKPFSWPVYVAVAQSQRRGKVALLVLTLDESQKAYLARKFEKNNEEFRDKYLDLTPEKQAKARFKKVLKQTDEWLGSVNREQETLIARYLDKHPPNYAQWLEDSIARQRGVLQLLTQIQTEKPNREAAQAMIQRAILASYEPSDQAERRAQSEASRAAMQQLVSAIIRASTSEQKTHARNKLQDWIDDCKHFVGRK